MASTVNRTVALRADQDEQVRALITRGINYSDFVQAATDILLSGELAKYGGLTPGESLRRALDRAARAAELERALHKAQDRIYYAVDWRHEGKDETLKQAWREIEEALRDAAMAYRGALKGAMK